MVLRQSTVGRNTSRPTLHYMSKEWSKQRKIQREINEDSYEAIGSGRSSAPSSTLPATAVVRIRSHAAAFTLWTA